MSASTAQYYHHPHPRHGSSNLCNVDDILMFVSASCFASIHVKHFFNRIVITCRWFYMCVLDNTLFLVIHCVYCNILCKWSVLWFYRRSEKIKLLPLNLLLLTVVCLSLTMALTLDERQSLNFGSSNRWVYRSTIFGKTSHLKWPPLGHVRSQKSVFMTTLSSHAHTPMTTSSFTVRPTVWCV